MCSCKEKAIEIFTETLPNVAKVARSDAFPVTGFWKEHGSKHTMQCLDWACQMSSKGSVWKQGLRVVAAMLVRLLFGQAGWSPFIHKQLSLSNNKYLLFLLVLLEFLSFPLWLAGWQDCHFSCSLKLSCRQDYLTSQGNLCSSLFWPKLSANPRAFFFKKQSSSVRRYIWFFFDAGITAIDRSQETRRFD